MKRLIGGMAFLAAFGGTPAHAQGDAAAGEALAVKWCASCHLLPGGTVAMDSVPAFERIANDPAKPDAYLRQWLNEPHEPMPPLQLDQREIDDLLAFIRSLRKAQAY